MIVGLSASQFERIAGMGPAQAHGKRVLIRAPRHSLEELGESRAYYVIDGCNEDEAVRLHPVGGSDVAESTLSKGSYAYTHGGSLFCAAVDAAKELADAWALRRR
jgi:hypothetical protein